MVVRHLQAQSSAVMGAGARPGISSDNAVMKRKVDRTMIRLVFILAAWS